MAESMQILCPRRLFGSFGDAAPISEKDIYLALQTNLDENAVIYFKQTGHEVVLDGRQDPEAMRKTAGNWNSGIQTAAKKAVEAWQAAGCPLDNQLSFNARKAIEAADNHFTQGLERAVIDRDFYNIPFFKTLVSDDLLKKIEDRPEDYLLLYAVYDF